MKHSNVALAFISLLRRFSWRCQQPTLVTRCMEKLRLSFLSYLQSFGSSRQRPLLCHMQERLSPYKRLSFRDKTPLTYMIECAFKFKQMAPEKVRDVTRCLDPCLPVWRKLTTSLTNFSLSDLTNNGVKPAQKNQPVDVLSLTSAAELATFRYVSAPPLVPNHF